MVVGKNAKFFSITHSSSSTTTLEMASLLKQYDDARSASARFDPTNYGMQSLTAPRLRLSPDTRKLTVTKDRSGSRRAYERLNRPRRSPNRAFRVRKLLLETGLRG